MMQDIIWITFLDIIEIAVRYFLSVEKWRASFVEFSFSPVRSGTKHIFRSHDPKQRGIP